MEEEEVNVDYGEIKASLKITCSQSNIDSIVDMATDIYYLAVRSEVPKENPNASDDLLERIRIKYKDFATSFPLILKWIVLTRQYHPSAFKKYLIMYSSVEFKTRTEFLAMQIEYLVYLHKESNSNITEAFCNNLRVNMLKIMMEEDNEFVEQHKNVEVKPLVPTNIPKIPTKEELINLAKNFKQ